MILKTELPTDNFSNFFCACDDYFHGVATPFTAYNLLPALNNTKSLAVHESDCKNYIIVYHDSGVELLTSV